MTFRNLPEGRIFIYQKNAYIKTEDMWSLQFKGYYCCADTNAVNLDTGKGVYIKPKARIVEARYVGVSE